MAILKSYLDESLLTQQEQAALRVCLHVTTLAEGVSQLDKLKANILPPEGGFTSADRSTSDSLKKLDLYLKHRIETVLTSYTAPSLPSLGLKDANKQP